MPGSGASGTMTPPSDGEHVAPVIPLRRRQQQPAPPRPARRTLSPEGGVWDTELEPDPSPALTSRPRLTMRAWPLWAARRSPTSWLLLAVAGAAAATAIVVGTVWASGGARAHTPRLAATRAHIDAGATSPAVAESKTWLFHRLSSATMAWRIDLSRASQAASHRDRHRATRRQNAASRRSRIRHGPATESGRSTVPPPAGSAATSSSAGAEQPATGQQPSYSPPSTANSQPSTTRPWGAGGTLAPGHSPDS